MTSAILFDIDGTLIHAKGAGRLAACMAMQSAFDAEPTSGEISFAGRTDHGIIGDLFELHSVADNESNRQRFGEEYLGYLPQTLSQTDGTVLPGVLELLAQLRQRSNFEIGILTGNTNQAAAMKLDFFAIGQYFDFGGYGDCSPNRNDVAQQAMDKALARNPSITPERVLVIGDTVHDVTCARSVSARAVAVMTGGFTRDELSQSKPDEILADLSDTKAVISLFERLTQTDLSE